jgi:tetratricopeptide (TPR) repeat protein
MSNVEKLKKKAAEFEQKKQFDRALEVYVQIIEHTKEAEEKDVAIYNRVGDLYLRLNKTDQAVHYYEQAVDLYTDGGYLNNAIALCNKILRHAPKRNQIYYKLGKISAKKGFNSDAKKNFLEYADRMHKAGRDTDAFKALEEFADLCPGQDDIRLMLADQLAKAGKTQEAVEQLQILHESLDAEGRSGEAAATVKRMHTLDPTVEPRRSNTPRSTESSGLVFLDMGHSPPKGRPKIEGLQPTSLAPEPPRRPRTPPHVQPPPEIDQLGDIELTDIELEIEPESSSVPGLETTIPELDIQPIEGLEGLESNASPESFELTLEEPEPEPEPESEPELEPHVEGLMGTMADDVIPDPMVGLDSRSMETPFDSNDPLAGLSVLEDKAWYDDNPLAGLTSKIGDSEIEPAAGTPPPAKPRAKAPEPDPEPEPEPVEIDTLGVEAVAQPEKAPEPEEVEEPKPKPKAAAKEKKAPHPGPDPDTLEDLAADQVPTRPKLVQDEAPPPAAHHPEPKPAEGGERKFPFNPFKRSAMAKKANQRTTPPRPEPPRASQAQKGKDAIPKRQKSSGEADFVDLADWLREDSAPRSTRMVASDDKRVGDEQADFTDMLEKFKAGVAANVDDEDFDSHYDLGVAYREMGLIDEAVSEFQKALRGAEQRIRAYEALGQCFIDRAEYDVAITVLSRALREPGLEDDDLIAVLYLLGYAAEENGQARDAAAYYQRVFAIDIDFRDVGERLKIMSKAAAK